MEMSSSSIPSEKPARSISAADCREQTLRLWLGLRERQLQAQFTLHRYVLWIELVWIELAWDFCSYNDSMTVVSGILVAVDPAETTLNVDQLKTPIGVYPQASIRASDCKYFVIPIPDDQWFRCVEQYDNDARTECCIAGVGFVYLLKEIYTIWMGMLQDRRVYRYTDMDGHTHWGHDILAGAQQELEW